MAKTKKEVRCSVIGYGGAFNMGKSHANWMNSTPGMRTVAVCDLDENRTKAAAEDFPGIQTYTDYKEMLKNPDIDLVAIVTPHNTHYPIAMDCLKAGKAVVLEKPMCITTKEATDMIEAAKKSDVMLTTFHNRRHDGDFMAIKEVIDKGIIGDVFNIEAYMGGYGHPGRWWRADKEISGGLFYDWGAHIVDWALNFVPGRKIQNITGLIQKRVWMDVTNEDEVKSVIRFDEGVVADIQMSQIAKVGKPRWRILGTKGGITDSWGGSFKVFTDIKGYAAEMEVKYKPSTWEEWYPNLAKHLLNGAELEVTPEESRRVIEVIEYTERSAKSGKSEPVPFA